MPYISQEKANRYGYDNPNTQTIIIPKNKFTLEEAQNWLKQNGWLYKNWRETINYYRFIQNDVVNGANYYSNKLNNGIILITQKW